jgi:hypothetical protein
LSAVNVVAHHLDALRARLAGRTNESPEALLNDLVPALIKGLAADAGRPGVDLRGQAHEGAIGRPDFSVKDGLLVIGHVETKAPGAGVDTSRFKGHDREQWQRFRRLPWERSLAVVSGGGWFVSGALFIGAAFASGDTRTVLLVAAGAAAVATETWRWVIRHRWQARQIGHSGES